MIEIKLEDIITNCKFGPIKLGDTKIDIINKFGTPQFGINKYTEESESISYDWFEFQFFKDKLKLIQNAYILNEEYAFNQAFQFENDFFKVTHWFNDLENDLKLVSIKNWLIKKQISFNEEPYYDVIRLNLYDGKIRLHFWSKKAYHNPNDWEKFSNEVLNWKLGAFYLSK